MADPEKILKETMSDIFYSGEPVNSIKELILECILCINCYLPAAVGPTIARG